MSVFRGRFFAIASLGAVLAFGALPVASADELQDVGKLVAGGRLIEAENRADAFLEKNPKDAQMRFLKGVILSQRGQRDAAVAMFTGLTQDYPELPEPYNNLAVIYAAQGKYDNARSVLEMAVRVAPNDATAYENLGDIYAALAARSYRDARRYDPKNAAAGRKLDLARTLLTSPPGTPAAPASPVAAAVPPSPAADINRSQRNIGLARPAGAPSIIAGTFAQAPDVIVPSTATDLPQGSNVVAIETPNPSAQTDTSTLNGAKTTVATVAVDPSQPIADITAVIDAWATRRSIAASDLKIRVDGDTAIARFRSHDQRTGKPVDTERALKLRKSGATWTVIDEHADS